MIENIELKPQNLDLIKANKPSIRREEAPQAKIPSNNDEKLKQMSAGNINLIMANKPEVKVEESPDFDYRSHSKKEAVKHIASDILGWAMGGGGIAGAGIDALRSLKKSMDHHGIKLNDLHKAFQNKNIRRDVMQALESGAKSGVTSGVVLAAIKDGYDTIRNNGSY